MARITDGSRTYTGSADRDNDWGIGDLFGSAAGHVDSVILSAQQLLQNFDTESSLSIPEYIDYSEETADVEPELSSEGSLTFTSSSGITAPLSVGDPSITETDVEYEEYDVELSTASETTPKLFTDPVSDASLPEAYIPNFSEAETWIGKIDSSFPQNLISDLATILQKTQQTGLDIQTPTFTEPTVDVRFDEDFNIQPPHADRYTETETYKSDLTIEDVMIKHAGGRMTSHIIGDTWSYDRLRRDFDDPIAESGWNIPYAASVMSEFAHSHADMITQAGYASDISKAVTGHLNHMFSLKDGVRLEKVFRDHHSRINDRRLAAEESNAYVMNAANETFVAKAQLAMKKYEAEALAFINEKEKDRIRAEFEADTLGIRDAYIAANNAKVGIVRAYVDAYRAYANSILQSADTARMMVDASKLLLEIFGAKIDAYKAENRAYEIGNAVDEGKLKIKEAEIRAYSSQQKSYGAYLDSKLSEAKILIRQLEKTVTQQLNDLYSKQAEAASTEGYVKKYIADAEADFAEYRADGIKHIAENRSDLSDAMAKAEAAKQEISIQNQLLDFGEQAQNSNIRAAQIFSDLQMDYAKAMADAGMRMFSGIYAAFRSGMSFSGGSSIETKQTVSENVDVRASITVKGD